MELTEDNRSWAEICDEEMMGEEAAECEAYEESLEEGELRNDSFNVPAPKAVKSEPSNDIPSSTPRKSKKKASPFRKSTNPASSKVDKPIIRNSLSYAKVLSQGSTPRKCSEVQPPLTNDDLSLTSHLDVFHVDSPQKNMDEPYLDILVDEDTMFSPCKPTTPHRSDLPKNTKRPFMLIDSPAREPRDRALHFPKIAKSEVGSDVHSKSKSNVGSPSSKRELEVNPEILCRRQKQIDYGKNTLGYDRYTKLIPKQERTKTDPKTPPKHLKMSRRAWDGLIKNWRMKLHKWDPVSDTDKPDSDNANSDQFSVSSEDPSSYDSSSARSDSTVSTPKKCPSVAESEDGRGSWSIDRKQIDNSKISDASWNKRRSTKDSSNNSEKSFTRHARKNDKSEDDDYLGCEPLTENCVKACS